MAHVGLPSLPEGSGERGDLLARNSPLRHTIKILLGKRGEQNEGDRERGGEGVRRWLLRRESV